VAQALSDIYNSLNTAYNPQRDLYNSQIAGLGAQTDAQVQGLGQQKQNAFNDITNGANANGMFYSGAPEQEQQRYVGGTYLPALANLQANASNQKYGLEQALAGVGVNQTNQANQIYQNQVGQDAQNNYYNQQLQMQQQQNQAYLNQMKAYSGGYGSSAQAAPTQNQVLASAFNGYDPTKQGRMANYTEQQIAPQIQAALNLPYNQALQLAYQYRKQVYHQ